MLPRRAPISWSWLPLDCLIPGKPEIFQWLDWLEANLPLPYYVYNMPGLTKVAISPKAVSHLLPFENCRGFKDSSLDLIYLKKVLAITKKREDFSVFVGPGSFCSMR